MKNSYGIYTLDTILLYQYNEIEVIVCIDVTKLGKIRLLNFHHDATPAESPHPLSNPIDIRMCLAQYRSKITFVNGPSAPNGRCIILINKIMSGETHMIL